MPKAEKYIRYKIPHQEEKCEQNDEHISTNRYPRREWKQPAYLENYVTEENSIKYNVDYCYRMTDIPLTYKEAKSSQESEEWQRTMEEEIAALKYKETYDLSPLSENRLVVRV